MQRQIFGSPFWPGTRLTPVGHVGAAHQAEALPCWAFRWPRRRLAPPRATQMYFREFGGILSGNGSLKDPRKTKGRNFEKGLLGPLKLSLVP